MIQHRPSTRAERLSRPVCGARTDDGAPCTLPLTNGICDAHGFGPPMACCVTCRHYQRAGRRDGYCHATQREVRFDDGCQEHSRCA